MSSFCVFVPLPETLILSARSQGFDLLLEFTEKLKVSGLVTDEFGAVSLGPITSVVRA